MATETNENVVRKYKINEAEFKAAFGMSGRIIGVRFLEVGNEPDTSEFEVTTDEAILDVSNQGKKIQVIVE